MNNEPNIAHVASLIGEPARAKMMVALMSGKALTATELAIEADIGSSTASSHLAKLINSELLVVRKQGRHKYFQLKDHQIAELIESLLNISARSQVSTISTGPTNAALRKARICYDHLAGEVAVKLLDALKARQLIVYSSNSDIQLSNKGVVFFEELGADISKLKQHRRVLCKACLDWSERRDHLAGHLGQWVLNDLVNRGWLIRELDSRVMTFSRTGFKQFAKLYGLPNMAPAN
ncbi:MAG: ArsR/SmtB family transcription factor [Vibrio gallaecicus]